MKFKLVLIAKMDNTEASSSVEIVTSAGIDGFPNTPQGAIDAVIQKLSELPGFSVS